MTCWEALGITLLGILIGSILWALENNDWRF